MPRVFRNRYPLLEQSNLAKKPEDLSKRYDWKVMERWKCGIFKEERRGMLKRFVSMIEKEEVEEKKKFEMIRLPLIWTDMTSTRLKYLNTSGINEG